MINVMELSKEAFGFEMNDDDDFASVLRKYMDEQNLSINDLAKSSGLSRRTIINYRAGHLPNDFIPLVMLCIGLKVNYSKAEYLFRLAHFSIGCDRISLVYRLLINLSFASDITIGECNEILQQLGFPKLKTTTNLFQDEKYEIELHIKT